MASTVTTRPNHYEVLGLAPTASAADIKAAFAREIGRPRAFDEALGLNRVKAPPLIARDRFSMALPAIHLGPPPRPEATVEPVAEPRIASFIASSLREAPVPRHDPPIAPQSPIAEAAANDEQRIDESDEQPAAEWRRPALAIGGLIAAVALIGAWAGVTAGNDAESPAPQRTVTVALPQAKRLPNQDVAAGDGAAQDRAAQDRAAVQQRRLTRPLLAYRPTQRVAVARPPAALAALASDTIEAGPSADGVGLTAADPLAPAAGDEPAVEATVASLPLSKATIARTIGRIGYACGAVASTEAIGGGAFKVTCTSGHSYRAAPVHGRYRFKRL